ncbi:MAG: nuclear transport factor 2 family protein [Dehalococcoidia bacterium]|nr:nuclear transport factor 2 family protein [Dehalococcoidia bacterium]
MDTARALADRLAVMDVLTRYGTSIDRADWERLKSCFASDARVHYGSRLCKGPDEVADFIRGATTGWAFQQHLLGSFEVTLDGDSATSSCYLIATQVAKETPGQCLVTVGVYRDRLVRLDGEWRIVERSLQAGWRGLQQAAPA